MKEISKAHKYRIYPTTEQQQHITKTCGCCRFVWNSLVAHFNNWKPDVPQEKLNEKTLKDHPDNLFLKEVHSVALQQTRRNFDKTKTQFFNKKRKTRIGRMQFKKKGISRDSYRLDATRFAIDHSNSTIRIQKLGDVKAVFDRKLPSDAKINSITISKTKSNKYFASIQYQCQYEPMESTGRVVGIDLGLADFAILSNGDKIANPRYFRKNQAEIATAQRHLSRKTKGSNRYIKQRIKLARAHERIANKRNYFLHALSTELIKHFDIICLETLRVSNMVKNRKLAKSIADAGWAEFVRQLKYKALWNNKQVSCIDAFYPSSKKCSDCGFKLKSLDLSTRMWICYECGCIHDRDHNASINILIKGLADLTSKPFETISAELVDYRRGEAISLFVRNEQMQASVNRLDKPINL